MIISPARKSATLPIARGIKEISAMLWIAGTSFAGVIASSMLLYLLF